MARYFIEPRKRKYIKGYRFLSFARIPSDKYLKKLVDTATEARLDALKTASKRSRWYKANEATGEFIENKIAETRIMKPKPLLAENSIDVEEIIILPEKREEILNELRQVL